MKNRIALVRKDAGLRQLKFAERLNLSRNFICLVESGERNLSSRSIADICNEFGVNETWLRTGEGSMHAQETNEQRIAQVVQALTVRSDVVKSAMITALSRMDEEDLRKLLRMILNAMTDNGIDVNEFLN